MIKLKHRRLLVRNSLTELEAGYLQMKSVGFEVDPDYKVQTSVQQALMDIHNESKQVICGIMIELPQGIEVAFDENGKPFLREIPPSESSEQA